jgi:hypothetical protein
MELHLKDRVSRKPAGKKVLTGADLTWTASHDFSSGDQFISAFPDLSPNRLADREIYDPQAP